jgi:phosphoserine phosphatase
LFHSSLRQGYRIPGVLRQSTKLIRFDCDETLVLLRCPPELSTRSGVKNNGAKSQVAGFRDLLLRIRAAPAQSHHY